MTDLSTLSLAEIEKRYKELEDKVERRKATCRASSRKYYHKTYKLNENADVNDIQKNKERLEKRDAYQKSYYQKNKDKIKIKQR